jgi:CBS domain-containing protein
MDAVPALRLEDAEVDHPESWHPSSDTRPMSAEQSLPRNVMQEHLIFQEKAMQVREIMHSGVHLADPDMTMRDAARRMRADNIGALPVGENDRLIGMVTDRDIVTRGTANGRLPGDTTVREVMSKGVCYCFEDDDVRNAAQIMARHQVRRLPALNRNKRLVGVVALADLCRAEDIAAQGALKGISEPTDMQRKEWIEAADPGAPPSGP